MGTFFEENKVISEEDKVPLTPEQAKQQALREIARRQLAHNSLLHFTTTTHPDYYPGWVHDDICRRLERFSKAVAERKSPRLMLLMPPRHGKLLADSTLVRVIKAGSEEPTWTVHGSLEVGDQVMGLSGWTEVIGKSAVRLPAALEVEFNDGAKIQAHEDHEWLMDVFRTNSYNKHLSDRRMYIRRVIETREMFEWAKKTSHKDLRATPWSTAHKYLVPEPNGEAYGLADQAAMMRRPGWPKRSAKSRFVVAVREVPEHKQELGHCIQVAAEDGVYLVTRYYIPTHNSELASIRFPAWHLGHHPHHEIINVGYNLDLPMKFSRKVRDVVQTDLYQNIFPGMRLDPKSQSVEAWNTTKGGGFTAAGVGGGITGKGAHILIIDDPIKNQEEADSVLIRDKLEDWYQTTAYTRLAPGGGVLVIETWWNDDDLAGRLQQRMAKDPEADQFEIIRYPALSTAWEYRHEQTLEILHSQTELREDDIPAGFKLLRPLDTGLHLDRYSTEALKGIQKNLEPRVWSALYQQNPVPDEGMYFQKDWFKYRRGIPRLENCRIVTAWDFAIGEKQSNDWTVGATVLQDEFDNVYLIDINRFKGDAYTIVESILDTALRFQGGNNVDYLVGVEDGQIWRALEPLLKKRMQERKLNVFYEPMRPYTDKMARARPLQGRLQQGRVYLPEEFPWVNQAVTEMLRFPAGAHDDVVDAFAWAVRLLMDKPPVKLRTERKKTASWKDRLLLGGRGKTHMSS